jgi:long-chain acyl-CoA synthetase
MRSRGLRQGDTVALLCGNRREFFEVMVAVMHAGLVVVPVNWHWVADELAYVMDDSEASALVVDGRFASVAAEACRDARTGTCVNRFVTDGSPPAGFEDLDFEEFVAQSSSEEPDEQVTGGVMFYTSGTTGFPKGVRSAATQIGLELAMIELLAVGASTMMQVPEDGVTLLAAPPTTRRSGRARCSPCSEWQAQW